MSELSEDATQRFVTGVHRLAREELHLAGLKGSLADMIAAQVAMKAANTFHETASLWVEIGRIIQQILPLTPTIRKPGQN